ncbi:MAG: ABC transporter ATP-binding protein [Planctomycetota bacterium]|jgi:NitT/TauT family transport system ATP-binding protein
MAEDIILTCEHVHHWFGSNRVLHDVQLRVKRGQFVSLVGPSGCGKSTLLRAIVGTHPPCQGRIMMYNEDQTGLEVHHPGRDRGIVYQRYSLFPFLTAVQNVAIGLMLDQSSLPGRFFKLPVWRKLRKRHLQEAAELLEKLNLGHAINNYPHELSGGMRQRVAVAQALIMKPRILLLDEPFGALDEATREELQRMLLTLSSENRCARSQGISPPYTILLVTHELNEAIYVGDRVVGLSQYWNWQEQGNATNPGATIVYDEAAPIYDPDSERDYHQFAGQRNIIRSIVFQPSFEDEHTELKTIS